MSKAFAVTVPLKGSKREGFIYMRDFFQEAPSATGTSDVILKTEATQS